MNTNYLNYRLFFYNWQVRRIHLLQTKANLVFTSARVATIDNRASLDPANKSKWETEGRKPHWRF